MSRFFTSKGREWARGGAPASRCSIARSALFPVLALRTRQTDRREWAHRRLVHRGAQKLVVRRRAVFYVSPSRDSCWTRAVLRSASLATRRRWNHPGLNARHAGVKTYSQPTAWALLNPIAVHSGKTHGTP